MFKNEVFVQIDEYKMHFVETNIILQSSFFNSTCVKHEMNSNSWCNFK